MRAAAAATAVRGSSTFRRVVERGRDMLSDILEGKPVKTTDLQDLAAEAVDNGIKEWGMGGNFPHYQPPTADVGDARFDPPPGAHRAPPRTHRRPPPPPAPEPFDMKELQKARSLLNFTPSEKLTTERITATRRAFAKRYHPDKPGGSVLKMQQINAACDLLEQWLSSRS